MTKATKLEDLITAWKRQKMAITKRTHAAAGYPDKDRWSEIVMAHYRRINRMDMGRSMRNRASYIAGLLNHNDAFGAMIRNNRKISELPEIIHTFGNSGTAKSQREASNAGN